jgi:hypothetical protein
MYRTIQVSSCVLIQGEFVEMLADGQVVVRDGKTEYRGRSISAASYQRVPAAMALSVENAAGAA